MTNKPPTQKNPPSHKKNSKSEPPETIPVDKVNEIIASTAENVERITTMGTTLVNLHERFGESFTSLEHKVIIETIRMFFPWYGAENKPVMPEPERTEENLEENINQEKTEEEISEDQLTDDDMNDLFPKTPNRKAIAEDSRGIT